MNDLRNPTAIIDSTDEAFLVDVIEASKKLPVIVDFWAPWCGPCKTLGPALEAAVLEKKDKIKLVKVDIDKNPNIAGQLRVQSIPAVFAFSNGQPVDGFMGAQTPAQLKEFISKIINEFGPNDEGLNVAIARAKDMLQKKDFTNAKEAFNAIIDQDTNLPEAHVGLLQALLGEKNLTEAIVAYKQIPESLKDDPNIKKMFAQIQLAEQSASAGELEEVRKKFLDSPQNLNLKFDLVRALIAEDQHTEAIDNLLEIIDEEPDWNGGKAKSQLFELLDALGPENPEARAGRRKLSSIIFS